MVSVIQGVGLGGFHCYGIHVYTTSHTHTHTHTHTRTHTHTHTHSLTHTHNTHTQDFLLTRIPRENVCIDKSAADPAYGTATLEVGLNNPILESGFEIICAPTSDPGSLEAVRKTLQVCQEELHPFFVYTHDGKSPLSPQVHVHIIWSWLVTIWCLVCVW